MKELLIEFVIDGILGLIFRLAKKKEDNYEKIRI